jgi:RHS repeat-associated protein
MTYDNEGQLESWQAPSGTNETDQFLYDGDGQRVLQRTSTTTGSTTNVTDTITFDGYTDTTITNGTTTDVTKYYSVQGQNVAMVNSQGWFTLVPDMQGGNTLVLNSNGSTKSVQLYAPYGSVRYSDGTSPTAHNYTGQRLDDTTGLLYYNSRYYDPISGCFTSTDTVETNASGSDPYAYVDDNPETKTDPTGQMMYDPATGQAGRIVNGKAEVWQYNSGIDSSGTFDTSSQVVASNIWSIYTWTWWTPPVYDVNWAPPVSYSAPVQKKADPPQDSPPGSCGLAQAACGNNIANYAVYTGGPYSFGVPGLFNPANVYPDNGEEDLGEGGGGSGKDKDTSNQAAVDAVGCEEGLSFIATTSVATTHGEQAIGTLKVGEKVWAYNPNTKKMEFEPILHVWINHDNDLVDLTITYTTKQGKTTKPASEVIHTNKKHPFLTVEKGFLPVGQIKLGMHVVEADGQLGVITGWKVVPGVQTMYNLEVAQDHTYAVGYGLSIVHNSLCSDPQAFSDAGRAPDKAGMTRAGRAFQKHTGREDGWIFGIDPGKPILRNQDGQDIIDEIVNNPDTEWENNYDSKNGRIVTDGYLPDGRGGRWYSDGSEIRFDGFRTNRRIWAF